MKLCFFALGLIFSFWAHAQIDTLSDEFNRRCDFALWNDLNVTEGWNASHMEELDADSTVEGHLNMMPYSTAWFQDRRSNLYFKEVAGDLVFTTKVYATNRMGTSYPEPSYSLTGAMLRSPKSITNGSTDWQAGNENYVFLALGNAATNHPSCSGCQAPHFEVKSTTNSISNLNVTSIDTAAADIRIARIGHAIIVLYALPGEAFQVRQRYDRSDMPDTLQVGLVSYTDWGNTGGYPQTFHNQYTMSPDLYPDILNFIPTFNPQIRAHFDYARFTELMIPMEYDGADFLDPQDVSDAELVSIFGFSSISTDPENAIVWRGTSSDWSDLNNWEGGVLPSAQDIVIIPNCSCAEISIPIFSDPSLEIGGLIVENNATLVIDTGSELIIDNTDGLSEIQIDGELVLHGLLVIED